MAIDQQPTRTDPTTRTTTDTDTETLDAQYDVGDDVDPTDPYMGAYPGTGDISRDDAAQYKYGETRNGRWRWQHTFDQPRVTDHAQQKWDERTPADSISIERAWLRSKRVKYVAECRDLTDADGTTPDSVRIYHGRTDTGTQYTVLFLVQARGGTCIRTVYPLDFIEQEPPVKAYLHALAQTFDTHQPD